MSARHTSRLIAAAALLALVASFLAPFPALAEESPPPAEPTAEAALLPDSAAPEAEATPDPNAAPPAEGEVSPTEAPALVEDPAAGPDLAEVIEALPDGTTLAVVGEDGELLPLASDEASEAAAVADPIWCPASVAAPTPNLNGCSADFGTMAELITWLSNDLNEPAMDGVIWIEAGAIAGGPFSFNGSGNFATLADYKLTLRGGWDGNAGSKVISGISAFSGLLQITNWRNDVTLTDITIAGAPAGDALVVTTSGNITLTRVESSGNSGLGARLETAGAGKSVAITDGQFNDNSSGGLYVSAYGPITLTNIIGGYYDEVTDTSHGNTGGYGAYLVNAYSGVTAGVTLKGVNTFSINSGDGLLVYSNGPITASDLTASGNTSLGRGAYLDNMTSTTAAGITLTGTNIFAGNASTGLDVFSLGPIKLNNLQAHASATNYGANLYNRNAVTAQPITLTGTNSFKYNFNTGLRIRSNGAITLNNIAASGSAASTGASITNAYGDYTSPVTLTGSNVFNDNYYDGLWVSSFGAIKAANLTAERNGLAALSGAGISLDNSSAADPMAVTLTGRTSSMGNYDMGIYVRSKGAISVQSLAASDTIHGSGADLNNTYGPDTSAQKVTLSGAQAFHGNYGAGLVVTSYGVITISSLTASGNSSGTSATAVSLGNATAATPQKVSLTGANRITDNAALGLRIGSLGAIAVSNLTASRNLGGGASLDNGSASTAQAVTLSGKNVFSDNGNDGLYVYSRGAVSIASVTANDNSVGYGVDINNRAGPADSPQKVTLSGVHQFNANGYDGLRVYSYGAISLSTAIANGNGMVVGNGVSLSNGTSAGPQPVTLSGSFTFDDNENTGLAISSKGAIKAANLTARGNGNAVNLFNSGAGAVGGVTLTGKNLFEGNAYTALSIESLGAITLSTVTASGNGASGAGSGAIISNLAASTPQKVTLTGTNLFNDNSDSGIEVASLGAISASNLSASGNGIGGWGYGAFLDNDETNAVGGVTLSGTSVFNANRNEGLSVASLGAIALNTKSLSASHNGGVSTWNGVTLSNANATSGLPGITVKGVSVFNGNTSTGLSVYTKGAITLSSLTASGNGGNGAWVHNNVDPLSTGGVTLSGTNVFSENGYTGLDVSSQGPITLSNLTANDNGLSTDYGYGANLRNAGAPDAAVKPIKLTGYGTFNGNLSQGLAAYSLGAISAANLTASGNQSDGVVLYNSDPGAVGPITLSGTNVFNGNDRMGLNVDSRGAVTISNLTASGNGAGGSGDGAWIYNGSATTPQAVKLTGYGTFNDNASSGLSVESQGALSAANLTARGNAASNGVYLNNSFGTAGITLTGANIFTGNGENGLYINSSGPVTLTKVTADDNTLSGLRVASSSSLTLTCGSFTNNGSYGLYANSGLDPLLIGVFASGNPSGNLYWAGFGLITSDVRTCPLN